MRREFQAGFPAVAVIGAAVGLLAGCSSGSAIPAVSPSPSPEATAPAVTAREAVVDPAALPSLQPLLPPVEQIGYALPADDGLRLALSAATAAGRRAGDVASITPIGSSPDLVGFRIRTANPDGTPVATSTLWYSLHHGRVVADSELLADGSTRGGVSFIPDGQVYLESVQDGRTQVGTLDPVELSVLGRLAQRAALTPTDPKPAAPDCSVQRCIALTFDDGPSEYTPALLQTLAANDAHATFFIRGSSVPGREQTLQALSVAGHQIGNHSQNHLRLPEQDGTTVEREIAETRALIEQVPRNGREVFRPPYGLLDDTVVSSAAAEGYWVSLWTVDPVDYRTTDPAVITSRVLASATRGAVVLSHDTLPGTEAAYQTIIPELRRAGYELVTLDQLLGDVPVGAVRRGR